MTKQLFRKILVPHDFSRPANAALQVAAMLAARERGRLIVVHAVAPFYGVPTFPPAEPAVWVPPVDLVSESRERLERLVKRTLGRNRVPSTCRVVIGDPFSVIVAAARGADSIVMATVGRSGLAHLLIGSTAEKVVRHAPVPVLTIRAGARVRGVVARSTAPRKA